MGVLFVFALLISLSAGGRVATDALGSASANLDADMVEESAVSTCEIPKCAKKSDRPIFFDMVHSNNAARIRLFIRQYLTEEVVPICMVTYADMRCDWFKNVNPNQKVPAVILPATATTPKETLFESNVIFEYLVERYNIFESEEIGQYILPKAPAFKHRSLDPLRRAKVNLMMRVHDLYIASPNCNQPGCTHTQGSLYLPPPGKFDNTGGRRAVDAKTRAGKFTELWTRWTWLEDFSSSLGTNNPYLAGDYLTVADMNWFPTAVFMEFLLKHVANWPTLFADEQQGRTRDFTALEVWGDWVKKEVWNPGPIDPKMKERFPKLTAWYSFLLNDPVFAHVRAEILSFWVNERHLDNNAPGQVQLETPERIPRFPPIIEAIKANPDLQWLPKENEASGMLEW